MNTRDKHSFESHNEDAYRNADVAYEPRDLGARGILIFLVVLLVFGVAIHLAAWGLYHVLSLQAQKRDPRLNPLISGQRRGPYVESVLQNTSAVNVGQFPQPRLQADDTGDMEKFRLQEETILNSKPWKDQGGSIHISIEDAMKQITQQGLPARPAAPEATSAVPQGTIQGAPVMQTESGNINLHRQDRPAAEQQPASRQSQRDQQERPKQQQVP